MDSNPWNNIWWDYCSEPQCACGLPLTGKRNKRVYVKKHVQTCLEAHLHTVNRAVAEGNIIWLQSLNRTQWPQVNQAVIAALNVVQQPSDKPSQVENTAFTHNQSQLDSTVGIPQFLETVPEMQQINVEQGIRKPPAATEYADPLLPHNVEIPKEGAFQDTEEPMSPQSMQDMLHHTDSPSACTESPATPGSQIQDCMRLDYWLQDEEPREVQWGGNRVMQKLKDNLFDPGYTVQDLKDRKNKVDGIAPITFAHYIMDWKSSTNASDLSADMVLKIVTKLVCKFNHNYPSTWKQLTGLVKPQDTVESRFERCVCQKHYFKPLPAGVRKTAVQNLVQYCRPAQDESPQDFQERMSQVKLFVCPLCKTPRYYINSYGRPVEKTIPYYYFGIGNQLRKLFASAKWAKHFNRNLQDVPYFNSPECNRLRRELHRRGVAWHQCIFLEVGHDGFQPWSNTSHRTTWAVWMRVKNVCPSICFRYMNVKELALWPQARRKRQDNELDNVNIQTSFRQIVKELKAMYTENGRLTVFNASKQQTQNYYVILVSLYADSPGQHKIDQAGGPNATYPCRTCMLEAVSVEGTLTKYPAGYINKTPITSTQLLNSFINLNKTQTAGLRKEPPQYPTFSAFDERLKLTDDMQMQRMQRAQACGKAHSACLKLWGVKGYDMFTQMLPYTSYNNLFLVPTYHMLLYGVVKGFWSRALQPANGVISYTDRGLMQKRAGGVVQTDDFNSRYSDIIDNMLNWKIYDWLTWVDVWAGFILRGIMLQGRLPIAAQTPSSPPGYTMPKSFTEMVFRMHTAVNFLVRPQDDYTDESMLAFVQDLRIFAQSMELTFGAGPATTYNLHVAVCRLPDQIRSRGQSGYEGELWLERSVQVLKRVLGDAVPHHPEHLMACRIAFDEALLALSNNAPGVIDITESLPTFCKDRQETVFIQQQPTSELYLCGKAVPWKNITDWEEPRVDQFHMLKELLLRPKDDGGERLTADEKMAIDTDQIYVYPRAELGASRKLFSKLLTDARQSESFWVLIVFQGRVAVPTIGCIQYFFTLKNVPDPYGKLGTFYAVVRLYRATQLTRAHTHVKPVYRVMPGKYDESTHSKHNGLRVINLASVNAKVHRYYDPTEMDGSGNSKYWYFQQYSSMSLT